MNMDNTGEGAAAVRRSAPGIVLFAAILNFVGALAAAVMVFLGILGLFSGGVADAVSQRLEAAASQAPLAFGTAFVFAFLLILGLVGLVFSLLVGVGLLRGRKFAWFIQVILSVFGLLGFPVFTVINALILVFFFQSRTREYFKV